MKKVKKAIAADLNHFSVDEPHWLLTEKKMNNSSKTDARCASKTTPVLRERHATPMRTRSRARDAVRVIIT